MRMGSGVCFNSLCERIATSTLLIRERISPKNVYHDRCIISSYTAPSYVALHSRPHFESRIIQLVLALITPSLA
jgi:hypothetical protein